ncbi:helix-turn-helix transcriptional regulator [Novosphingobium terrae]|uniref:helix-turn-helix transcriptional regulator n=1 Tax=Novosphingobium terrae TaxID=2726189 RepID=UPI0019812B77|nr:autoinducer binding domain-containing protein [Novosphingobium terrae]
MRLHRLVETFDESVRRCHTLGDIAHLLETAGCEMGFERFAMAHGLWFQRPEARLIRIDNYGDYGEQFISRKDYLHDPVMNAGQRASKPFGWSQLGGLTRLGRRQMSILIEAERHGIRSGLTLPVGVPGEPWGSCSFATSKQELPSRWHCRAAMAIAASAFHEARRLCGYPARAQELPVISRRKIEILQRAALGETDPEIAMILGLSRSTIETYMTQLRQAFNVGTRTQLCVYALRAGLIGFEDILSGF